MHAIFDFSLTDLEMKEIDGLPSNKLGHDPQTYGFKMLKE